MTFFITPFHYTDCFSVRQIGYGGKLIDGFTGADYEICSFVSEKNTQVDAVQFVMTTPAIEEAEARRAPAQEAQTLSLWQRLLALFQ